MNSNINKASQKADVSIIVVQNAKKNSIIRNLENKKNEGNREIAVINVNNKKLEDVCIKKTNSKELALGAKITGSRPDTLKSRYPSIDSLLQKLPDVNSNSQETIDYDAYLKAKIVPGRTSEGGVSFQQSQYGDQIEEVRQQYEDTDKWMKAPNGKDTNLTEEQWLLVRTPAFKEWFGDWENDPENASIVVDENGEPLAAFHRNPSIFTVFDSRKGHNTDITRRAFHVKQSNITKGKHAFLTSTIHSKKTPTEKSQT